MHATRTTFTFPTRPQYIRNPSFLNIQLTSSARGRPLTFLDFVKMILIFYEKNKNILYFSEKIKLVLKNDLICHEALKINKFVAKKTKTDAKAKPPPPCPGH